MTHDPLPTNPRELKKALVSDFSDQLPLELPHDRNTPKRLLELSFLATGRRTSITDAWEQRHHTTNTDAFFDHFHSLDAASVESAIQGMNARILHAAKSSGVLPKEGNVAFDIHVDEDYTKTHEGCIGYSSLAGTDYGMAYLSADLVTHDPRFTLALTPIRAATNREEALRTVVLSVLPWVDITLALLDRGFQAVYAFRLFASLGKRFVIPLISNPRLDRLEQDAWRLKQAIPNTPYWWHVVRDYTMGSKKRNAVMNVVFFYEPDPKDPSRLKPFIFATNAGDLTADFAVMLAEHYRDRWGIETGYRVKDTVRLRTTTAHYPTRLFLQLFSIIAFNLWVLLRVLRVQEVWVDERPMRQGYLLRYFRDDLVACFAA